MEYRIKYGDRILHALSLGRSVLNGKCLLEAGTVGSLSFSIPPGHPYHDDEFGLKGVSGEITLEQDGVELFRGPILNVERDIDNFINIECEGMLTYLRDTRVRPCSNRASDDLPNGTVLFSDEPFNYLINRHNTLAGSEKTFEIDVDPHLDVPFTATDYPTTYDAITDSFCTGYDRFLYARTGPSGQRVISLLDGGIGEGSQTVVFGENLVDLHLKKEARDVVSVIIARGSYDDKDEDDKRVRDATEPRDFGLETVSDGLHMEPTCEVWVQGDRAMNMRLIEKFGYVEEMRQYEASTPSELMDCVGRDLSPDNLKTRELESFEISAVDLNMLNPNIQPIRLLEWVLAYSEVHEVNQYVPCSKIDIDINNPGETVYTFGDLEQTLTRESSLRLGLQRRNTGALIRKADGQAYRNELVAGDVEEVKEDVKDAIDENNERWEGQEDFNSSVTQTQKELIDGLGEIGDGIVKLGEETDSKIDGLQALIDALEGDSAEAKDALSKLAQDIVKAAQESVYEGTCGSSASTAAKTVVALAQNGRPFALEAGVMVRVTFQSANTADNPTLNVNDTGARPITTNGFNQAFWEAGQSVLLQYDGARWMCCASPVWVESETVGDPLGFNIRLEARKIAMRLIEQEYILLDPYGIRVGFEALAQGAQGVGTRNIQINSNYMAFRQGQTDYMKFDDTGIRVGMEKYRHILVGSNDVRIRFPRTDVVKELTFGWDDVAVTAKVRSDDGLRLESGHLRDGRRDNYLDLTGNYGMAYLAGTEVVFFGDAIHIGGYKANPGHAVQLKFWATNGTYYNNKPLDMPALVNAVRTSIVTYVDNNQYVWINKSDLGLGSVADLSHYAFLVTNGDTSANDFFPVGTAKDAQTLVIQLDRAVTGNIRLNIFGVQCDTSATNDPADTEGPSIFDSPEAPDETEVV